MVQHFINENFIPAFSSQTRPECCYMGKIRPELSRYPRIMHSHENHVEISIITSGISKYFIQSSWHTIKKGDILIYNSNIAHDELSSTDAQIGSYFFAIGNLHLPYLRANALIPDDIVPIFHITHGFDRIVELCESMIQNSAKETCEWENCIGYYNMMALLEILWRTIHIEKTQPSIRKDHCIVKKTKDYIDAHYHESLCMESICDVLGFSQSYLTHTFKSLMGYTPMKYAMRRKIGEAQSLLISTDLSATEIAQALGFDAQSHLNQRFKQYVGISPIQFRNNYRSKA